MSHMLIDYYKAIEDSSAKMLEAAKLKDWDGVVRYEGACAVLIEQLRFKSQEHELLPEHRREKTRIMQRILRNDARSVAWRSPGWRSSSTCSKASHR